MNLSAQAKLAESAEQYLVCWPLFFGLIGLNTGASAWQFFYSPYEFTWMRILDGALEFAMLGVVALFLWRCIRFVSYAKACNSRGAIFLEGFLQRGNLHALAFSWFFTFFMAQALGEWTEPDVLFYGVQEIASLQPPRFYLYVLVSCQCVSYALLFFVFSRPQEEDNEQ